MSLYGKHSMMPGRVIFGCRGCPLPSVFLVERALNDQLCFGVKKWGPYSFGKVTVDLSLFIRMP